MCYDWALLLIYLCNFNVTDVLNNNDYIFLVENYVFFLRRKNENTTEKRYKSYVLVTTKKLDKFLEDNKWIDIN